MRTVLDVIAQLAEAPITRNILEQTRLGREINDIRRQNKNSELNKRAKALVRNWRKIVEQEGEDVVVLPSNGHGSEPPANPRLTTPAKPAPSPHDPKMRVPPLSVPNFNNINSNSLATNLPRSQTSPPLIMVDDDPPEQSPLRSNGASSVPIIRNISNSSSTAVSNASKSKSKKRLPVAAATPKCHTAPSSPAHPPPPMHSAPPSPTHYNGNGPTSPSSRSNVSNKRYRRDEEPIDVVDEPLAKKARIQQASSVLHNGSKKPDEYQTVGSPDSDFCEVIDLEDGGPKASVSRPTSRNRGHDVPSSSRKKTGHKSSRVSEDLATPTVSAKSSKRSSGGKSGRRKGLGSTPSSPLLPSTQRETVKTTSELVAALAQKNGDSLLAKEATKLAVTQQKSADDMSKNKMDHMIRYVRSLPSPPEESRSNTKGIGSNAGVQTITAGTLSSRNSTPIVPITPSPPPVIIPLGSPESAVTTTISSSVHEEPKIEDLTTPEPPSGEIATSHLETLGVKDTDTPEQVLARLPPVDLEGVRRWAEEETEYMEAPHGHTDDGAPQQMVRAAAPPPFDLLASPPPAPPDTLSSLTGPGKPLPPTPSGTVARVMAGGWDGVTGNAPLKQESLSEMVKKAGGWKNFHAAQEERKKMAEESGGEAGSGFSEGFKSWDEVLIRPSYMRNPLVIMPYTIVDF